MFLSLASLSSQLTPFLALVQEEKTPESGGAFSLLPIVLIGGLFWFLFIAPEKKLRKARLAMLAELKKNDSVVTTGGLYGVITRLDDDSVTLRIDKDVHVRVQRSAISGLPNQEKEAESKPENKPEPESKPESK